MVISDLIVSTLPNISVHSLTGSRGLINRLTHRLHTQSGNKVAKTQQVLIGQLLLIITIGLIVTVQSK